MSTLSYDLFNTYFQTLPDEYKTIVVHLIQNMDHTKNIPPKEIRYKRGFTIALQEHELTIKSLARMLEIKNKHLEGSFESGIATLIEQSYKGSSSIYMDMVCEFLGIDEAFLITNSEYMDEHTKDIEWCFETLSSIDQHAIYNLVIQLNSIESIRNLPTILNKTVSCSGVSSVD